MKLQAQSEARGLMTFESQDVDLVKSSFDIHRTQAHSLFCCHPFEKILELLNHLLPLVFPFLPFVAHLSLVFHWGSIH